MAVSKSEYWEETENIDLSLFISFKEELKERFINQSHYTYNNYIKLIQRIDKSNNKEILYILTSPVL